MSKVTVKSEDDRTPGEKRRDTIMAKDPNFYKNIGREGGKNGGRPFRDIPGMAKKAGHAKWAKVRKLIGNEVIGG